MSLTVRTVTKEDLPHVRLFVRKVETNRFFLSSILSAIHQIGLPLALVFTLSFYSCLTSIPFPNTPSFFVRTAISLGVFVASIAAFTRNIIGDCRDDIYHRAVSTFATDSMVKENYFAPMVCNMFIAVADNVIVGFVDVFAEKYDFERTQTEKNIALIRHFAIDPWNTSIPVEEIYSKLEEKFLRFCDLCSFHDLCVETTEFYWPNPLIERCQENEFKITLENRFQYCCSGYVFGKRVRMMKNLRPLTPRQRTPEMIQIDREM